MHRRQIAVFYFFLTMLSSSSQYSIDNDKDSNKHQQSKDIHVEAFVKPRHNLIQLNITILKQVTSDYEIFITNIQNDSNETNHCAELKHCIAHGHSNHLSTVVPENGAFETSYDHCKFQAKCNYKIHVKSFDDKFDETLIYRTKDCVDGRCACTHEKDLPVPSLSASIKGKMLTVKWNINRNDLDKLPQDIVLEFLTIDIQEILKCNKSHTTIKDGDIGTSFEQILSDKLTGDYTKKFDHNISGECIRIKMNVLDSQHCHGPSNMIMVEAFEKSESNNYTFTFILIIFIIVIVLFSLIMFAVYGYIWWSRRCSIMNQWRGIYNPQNRNSTQLVPMIENRLYLMRDSQEDDFYEIPAHAIKEIGREIGKGAFGRVYIARLREIPGRIPSQIVAIKKLKRHPTPEQFEEFLSEIQTMKRVGRHPNIVRLLGSCKVDQSLMMVMEYVPCGDLLKYLRAVRSKHEASLRLAQQQECQLNHNNNNTISNNNNNNNSMRHSTSSQILGPLGKYLDIFHSHSTSSASETSSYITQPDSLPSGITAVFNGTSRPSFNETTYTNLTSNPDFNPIMPSLEYIVDSNELHNFAIQIARGMRHLEEKSITHRDLAARNILIDENKNLKISDFGLSRNGIYVNTRNKKVPLRWLSVEAMKDNLYSSKSDVWSFAILLWEIGTLGGFPYPTVQNHELLNFLKSGQRLERPENCSEALYELMLQCWATDPDDRPNFSDICKTLDRNRIYIDFSELSPTYVFPPTSEEFKNNNVKCERHSKE